MPEAKQNSSLTYMALSCGFIECVITFNSSTGDFKFLVEILPYLCSLTQNLLFKLKAKIKPGSE